MRRLLAVLTALLLAAPAWAATDPPQCGGLVAGPGGSTVIPAGCNPYQSFRSSDRSKHVMVLRPSRWLAQSAANLSSIRRNSAGAMGNLVDQMEMAGLEVHQYDSEFFESDADHKEMWTNAGSKYALCIVLSPQSFTGGGAGSVRYACADSTNIQLLIYGGGDQITTGWSATDTTARGFVDTNNAQYVARSDVNNAGCATYDGVDTLWANFIAAGRRKAVLDANVTRVVRLLKPFTLTNVAFAPFADSANHTLVTGQDSVANSAEVLGPMWRVDFTNYSGQGNTAWINSLASGARGASEGGASPKSVYWVKTVAAEVAARGYPHLVWALICRFTTAAPIKWAYDWDDVTDKFGDNLGQPPRWRGSAVDSSLRALAAFGIVPTTMVNPDHAAAYIRRQQPAYEVAWSGSGHGYLQGMTWVHHSHDSTYAGISSNLIGGFGGYSSGNGSNIVQGATSIQKWGHRYASRWNPGANEAGFIGGTANFGLVQRLAYSDSVRRSVAQNALVPPYLAFPANETLPVGWKARPTTTNPLWTVNFSAGLECPIDSTFWAYDTMLVGGNGRQTRKLYIRTATDNPRGYFSGVAQTSLGTTTQWDRDSVVAASPFLYPNERYTIPVSGRLVQAIGVNSFLQGASPRAQYQASGNYRTAFVLGLRNPVQRAEPSNDMLGESFTTDANSVYAPGSGGPGGGGITGTKDFTGRMATRVVYQHPGQHGDTQAQTGDYHVDVFVLSMATQMRIMDKLAGRKTQVCVPAWKVYE